MFIIKKTEGKKSPDIVPLNDNFSAQGHVWDTVRGNEETPDAEVIRLKNVIGHGRTSSSKCIQVFVVVFSPILLEGC
jgi:hypothetical protein